MSSKKRIQAAKRATRNKVSLRKACTLLHVNRSSVYKSLKPSQRALDDEVLAQQIKAIQLKHQGCYGVDRMTGELRRKGIYVNHKRVARVMKLYKLNAIIRKKRNYFCDVEQVPRKGLPGNVLNRKFSAEKPGKKLVSDVTYLPTSDGQWCYASLVKDLCTSEIVACVTGKGQTLNFGIKHLSNWMEKFILEPYFIRIRAPFIHILHLATH